MKLGEAFTAICTPREVERNRFLSPHEFELAQKCRKRRKHREAERDMKN